MPRAAQIKLHLVQTRRRIQTLRLEKRLRTVTQATLRLIQTRTSRRKGRLIRTPTIIRTPTQTAVPTSTEASMLIEPRPAMEIISQEVFALMLMLTPRRREETQIEPAIPTATVARRAPPRHPSFPESL